MADVKDNKVTNPFAGMFGSNEREFVIIGRDVREATMADGKVRVFAKYVVAVEFSDDDKLAGVDAYPVYLNPDLALEALTKPDLWSGPGRYRVLCRDVVGKTGTRVAWLSLPKRVN